MVAGRYLWLVLGAVFVALPALAQDVSEEAERHMFRGQAAMQEATDASGYRDAVSEFKQATRLAPDWADAWFNLGVAQEKLGDLPGAMSSFKRYLELSPNAPDKQEVRALIYKLEYLNDKATKEAQSKRDAAQRERTAEAKIVQNLAGEWKNRNYVYEIRVSENSITINLKGSYNTKGRFNSFHAESFSGTINGLRIKGQYKYDYRSSYPKGGKLFTSSFSGKIDESGRKINLEFYVEIPETDKKRRVTGWLGGTKKYELTKKK